MTRISSNSVCVHCNEHVIWDRETWTSLGTSLASGSTTCPANPKSDRHQVREFKDTSIDRSHVTVLPDETPPIFSTGCSVCDAAKQLLAHLKAAATWMQNHGDSTKQYERVNLAQVLMNDAERNHSMGRHTAMKLNNPDDPLGDGERKSPTRPKKSASKKKILVRKRPRD